MGIHIIELGAKVKRGREIEERIERREETREMRGDEREMRERQRQEEGVYRGGER